MDTLMLQALVPILVLCLGKPTIQDAPTPGLDPQAGAAPVVRPVVGQPAPEPGLAVWLDGETKEKGVTKVTSTSTGSMLPTSRRAHTLADLADHVVIVHTFAWSDGAAKDKALPLVRDLLAANSDRRLAAIGIADGLELDAARSEARARGLEHPIAIEKLTASRSPYVDVPAHPVCFAFVVGRGGGLVWQGNPAADEKGFLGAVRDALDVHAMLPVERRLHERLGKALAEYYAGRLARAAALARDEVKAAEKSGDKTLVQDAEYLAARAKEAQLAWLREVGDAAAKTNATEYAVMVRACKAGFARGDVQKDLERLDREAHKDGFFEMRLLDAEKYLDLLEGRPVLFPSRKDPAGDKFAAKLESFVRSTANSGEETRTAKDLVDRYRLTAR